MVLTAAIAALDDEDDDAGGDDSAGGDDDAAALGTHVYSPGAVSCDIFTALSSLYHNGGTGIFGAGDSNTARWLQSNDPCYYLEGGGDYKWYGVSCAITGDIENEVVSIEITQLDEMSGWDATGTIPTQLGMLSALTGDFEASENSFTGTIPTEVGKLTNLDGTFSLSSNRDITGTIPSQIGGMISMAQLSQLPEGRASVNYYIQIV